MASVNRVSASRACRAFHPRTKPTQTTAATASGDKSPIRTFNDTPDSHRAASPQREAFRCWLIHATDDAVDNQLLHAPQPVIRMPAPVIAALSAPATSHVGHGSSSAVSARLGLTVIAGTSQRPVR